MPTREPLDAVVGFIIGVVLGLGACLFIDFQTGFFPRHAMWYGVVFCGAGAILCGVLGDYKGNDFFRSLRDYWSD